MVEESIGDDFIEESVNDEVTEPVQASQSQSFSVHDADEESKDQVMEMQV